MKEKLFGQRTLGYLKQLPLFKRLSELRQTLDVAMRRIDMLERGLRQVSQYVLQDHYQHPRTTHTRSIINSHELKVFSQNGEDGILLYIFAQIGSTDRRFIEFGVEDGRECNSANLSLNFGWSGLLIDADRHDVASARDYYRERLGTTEPVHIVEALVTPATVNDLFQRSGFSGEMDLLSIDIDGNDYWVWQAVEIVRPRVVVVEYNASLGAERSVTVAYEEQFSRFARHPTGFYHGASLAALTRLADAKGYALVGCDSNGVNAFFVRRDILRGALVEIAPEQAFYPLFFRTTALSVEAQFAKVRHLPFVQV